MKYCRRGGEYNSILIFNIAMSNQKRRSNNSSNNQKFNVKYNWGNISLAFFSASISLFSALIVVLGSASIEVCFILGFFLLITTIISVFSLFKALSG